MPWTQIAILVGLLILVGGVLWFTYRLAYSKGKSEVTQAIAENEAERRAKDAEILSRTHVDRPLGRMRPK